MSRAVTVTSFLACVLAGSVLFPSSAEAQFDLQGATIEAELILPSPPIGDEDGVLDRRNPNIEDVIDHFNYANCLCGEGEKNQSKWGARVYLNNAPNSFNDSGDVEFPTGVRCESPPDQLQAKDMNCVDGPRVPALETLRMPQRFEYTVRALMSPNDECLTTESGERFMYVLIDNGAAGFDEGSDLAETLLTIPFDMQPPPIPTGITMEGAENAVGISWDLPTSRVDDIRYFQVLCHREEEPANENDPFPSHEPQYLTSLMACGEDLGDVYPVSAFASTAARGPDIDGGPIDAAVPAIDAAVPDAQPGPDSGPNIDPNLPPDLRELNPAFICGQASGTDTGIRVKGLTNNVPYRMVLLTIDNARNVQALDLGVATPEAVEDGWEHYKENGGNADGGYCFVATATYGNYDHPFVKILRTFRDDTLAHFGWGRAFIDWYYENSPGLAATIANNRVLRTVSYIALTPLVAFAAVLEFTGPLGKLGLVLAFALALRLRRRRKLACAARPVSRATKPRRLAIATTAVLALLAFSTTANAQGYWEAYNEDVQTEPATPHWNLEIKFGPYAPNVDASAGGNTPFADIFGDSAKVMTVFGLDRYFTFPSGQLGISATLGFSNRSAKAFSLDESGEPIVGDDGEFVRSSGDSTSFRLMPTSLGAVYRFTKLDDDYGVPIVPYGKLALAYYLWWFTDPNGDIAESPTAACPDAGAPGSTCDGNFGRGGSLGYQATLGIAIRAERIDPSAELSLRTEMGIEHAGFFAEVQLASVDGFGASDKLSVSDTTWFGGINFEF